MRRPAGTRVGALLVLVAVTTGFATQDPEPRLVPTQDLPDDVAILLDETWTGFLDAAPAHRDCIGTVRIELVGDVDGGDAAYRPDERLILVEIPTSPRRFPESVVHELAHHLDAVCRPDRDLRSGLRIAQGIEADRPWARSERWEDRPAEHLAEAVVEVVRGERVLHGDLLPLAPETVELVERWLRRG